MNESSTTSVPSSIGASKSLNFETIRKGISVLNDETEFNVSFDNIFSAKGTINTYLTIASLPSRMFYYMNQQGFLKNWNNRDELLHLIYASLIGYYRKKSLDDEQRIGQMIQECNALNKMFKITQENYIKNKNEHQLLFGDTYFKKCKMLFDRIELDFTKYMNKQDIVIALNLQKHYQKNEIYAITYYSWCIAKYKDHLNLKQN